jgi:hypothetical protein
MGQYFRFSAAWKEPEFSGKLGCLVMVVVTVVMVMRRGERRSGERHDQKHCSNDLLHSLNVA